MAPPVEDKERAGDEDLDGYGSELTVMIAADADGIYDCAATEGASATWDDCDDIDPSVNPGALTMYADADGTVPATFQVIYLTGWSPHESQQRPLPRGSGQISLKDLNKDLKDLGVEFDPDTGGISRK